MDKKVVKGILTDGDARRSLRYNFKLDNLKKIMTLILFLFLKIQQPQKLYQL